MSPLVQPNCVICGQPVAYADLSYLRGGRAAHVGCVGRSLAARADHRRECRNCGGEGFTHDAPVCPACEGRGWVIAR